jgi:cell division protein FtsZ
LINLDFADVKTIMTERGSALMGIGVGTGENRAAEAAKKAISSPLLETSIDGAKGVLMNITGGANLSLYEVNEAADIVSSASDPEVNMIFGSVINEELKDEILVTVIATGFDETEKMVNNQQRAERPRMQQSPASNQSHSSQNQSQPQSQSQGQSREESQSESRSTSYTNADSDTLDIPTFLRNRSRNRRR